MDVVIVEDEAGAAGHLKTLLMQFDPSIRVRALLRSVEESIHWFASNPHPDLGFFDIQLNDGLSFDIFQQTNISFPVIFTTAFNQYAIQAFRVNSIDYLLKPVKGSDLSRALNKYGNTRSSAQINYTALAKEMATLNKHDIFTLLVNYKDRIVPIQALDFSYFHIGHGLLHGTASGKVYSLSMTMDELQELLDTTRFFRVNRQCIVNRRSIVDIQSHFNSKLALRLDPPAHETIMVSKARVPAFKTWLSSGIQ